MSEKIVAAYYKYMVDIAVLFGADRERATRELKESLDFEIALANVGFATHANYTPGQTNDSSLIDPCYRSRCPSRNDATPPNCTTP